MQPVRNEIGVIIGRFQVHELHNEHKKLIHSVLEQHEKVLLFLGTTPAIGTRRNPLDFITRKAMIEEAFPNITMIMPLPDQKEDGVWSRSIDNKIIEVFGAKKATIYGSRDSFIPYYEGRNATCELEPESYVSATDIREKVSKNTRKSADFRAGIIYSIYSQYPFVFSTIDVVIIKGDEILLARKPGETGWRFVGGFVDVGDDTELTTVKREAREETGLELSDFEFICSAQVNDWRYRKDSDRGIMTHFYKATYSFGAPTPMDDIAELKWFKDEPNVNNILVKEHKILYKQWKLKTQPTASTS